MFKKLTNVQAMSGLMLKASFEGGAVRVYDVSRLQNELPVFCALSTTPGLFESVHLGAGGYGVVWNDELDLAAEEIWQNGQPVQERPA